MDGVADGRSRLDLQASFPAATGFIWVFSSPQSASPGSLRFADKERISLGHKGEPGVFKC